MTRGKILQRYKFCIFQVCTYIFYFNYVRVCIRVRMK